MVQNWVTLVIETISCKGSRLKAVASHEQSGANGNKYFKLFFDRASSNPAFQLLKSVLKLLLKNPQSIFSDSLKTFELAMNKVLKIWKVENKKDSIVVIITSTFMIKGVYRLINFQQNGIINRTVPFPLSRVCWFRNSDYHMTRNFKPVMVTGPWLLLCERLNTLNLQW